MEESYFGSLGLVLLFLVLLLVFLPIVVGVGVCFVVGVTGLFAYVIVIGVSVLLWFLLWFVYFH